MFINYPLNSWTRSGDTINSSLLQSLIRMFIDLSIYHDVFEEPFLRRTQLFYRSEGERLVHSMDMADYLQHVDQRLKEEGIDRINAYVDSSTKPKLIKLVETELLERHVDTILEKGSISLNGGFHLYVRWKNSLIFFT
jgi:hypothetical protein